MATSTRANGTVGGGTGFTVSAFIDPNAGLWVWAHPNNQARVIDFGNGAGNAGAHNVILSLNEGMQLSTNRPDDGNPPATDWTDIRAPQGSHPRGVGERHVAATITCEVGCDGDTPTGTAKLFLDGVVIASELVTFRFPTAVGRSNLYVGKSHWWHDPWYKGTMRDLHVWDVALSDDQVADIPAVHGRAIRNHRDEFVDAVDDSADTRNEPVGLRRSIVFDKGSVSPQEALVVVAVILGFWVCRRRRDDLARNYQMGRRGCCHCVFILLKFVCVCPPILD